MAAQRRSAVAGVVRTPVGASAAVLLAAVLLLAIVTPLLWTDDANTFDTDNIGQGVSAEHWAGTDNLGRDIFFRVLVATRLSVELALLATAIGVLIGLVLGAAPMLLGRRAGRVVTAVVNIAVAFPGLLLALFFAVIFGVGAKGAVLAIGLAVAPGFARLVQTLVATVAGHDFIAAARISGVGRIRLLIRHVLPNIGEPLVVNATIAAGGSLLAFAGLSFLGLGVQAPDYDWGRLLGEGLNGVYVHPAAALAPGIAVVLAGLAFNLFGEAIAKAIGLAPQTILGGRPVTLPRRPSGPAVPVTAGDGQPGQDTVLDVQDLRVAFPSAGGTVTPVRGVSFALRRGEAVGVVGESGSGKSLTALAVARLIEPPGQVAADRLEFCSTDLLRGPSRAHRQLLGTSFAMVFQDPMTSFNPTKRIGRQLAEVGEQHQGLSRRAAIARAVDRLRAVRVPAAARRARQFPHEFSGGMRQRAMIGMGLMGRPRLIVADEPTTALDVTVQRQVLRLLAAIRQADDVALLLISHDITIVGQVCDRVLVMYAGRIVEDLPAAELHGGAAGPGPRHPYTRALLAAVPDMGTDRSRPLAVIPGRPADPANLPAGCAFAPRCALATDLCRSTEPELVADPAGRRVACWQAGEVPGAPAEPVLSRVGDDS
jgi:oligopeptide/dipeptide ABC transporter ATP-binding protein